MIRALSVLVGTTIGGSILLWSVRANPVVTIGAVGALLVVNGVRNWNREKKYSEVKKS